MAWGTLLKLGGAALGGVFGGGEQHRQNELEARLRHDQNKMQMERDFQNALLGRSREDREITSDAWKNQSRADRIGSRAERGSPLLALLNPETRARVEASSRPSESHLEAADALRRSARPKLEPGSNVAREYGQLERAKITDDETMNKLMKRDPWWKRLLGGLAGGATSAIGAGETFGLGGSPAMSGLDERLWQGGNSNPFIGDIDENIY